MLFPWLVDLVCKGHPNQGTSFVTRLLAPAFSASVSAISPGRGQRSPAASHSPVSQTCLAVSTLPHLQEGRTASPSVSCKKKKKTTGSLSPRTTFCCYLCAKSRVGPVCSVQEVQGLSPWGHGGPQSCRCPLAHNSFVYSTT